MNEGGTGKRTKTDSARVPAVEWPPSGASDRSDGTSQPSWPSGAPPIGTTVGRFIVLGLLGVGGMGVVLLGYDSSLDRKVALKLCRPHLHGAESLAYHAARLLREAQVMAKIAHPNVLTVYDVGMFEDRIFLALEYIDGETLARWLERPRSWREIVDKFVAAARGLEAAHALGLVHRDFKPQNVLVARDGRVLVTDFGVVGLATKAAGGTTADPPILDGSLT